VCGLWKPDISLEILIYEPKHTRKKKKKVPLFSTLSTAKEGWLFMDSEFVMPCLLAIG
jgi:hypothetical protein